MRCVFNSVDEDNYSRISVTIPPLSGCKYTAIRCDSFTCNCNIRVLKSGDYLSLTVGNKPITIYFDDWCNLNVETFSKTITDGKYKKPYDIKRRFPFKGAPPNRFSLFRQIAFQFWEQIQ